MLREWGLVFFGYEEPEKHDVWIELFEEYAIIFGSLFFENAGLVELCESREIEKLKKVLESHRILQEIKVNIEEIISDTIKIEFESKAILTSYNKGRICRCIPIPGKFNNKTGDEPQIVKTPEIVIDFIRRHLDMQFEDIHCMLRLPIREQQLNAGV